VIAPSILRRSFARNICNLMAFVNVSVDVDVDVDGGAGAGAGAADTRRTPV
jgi:hypothetical protein